MANITWVGSPNFTEGRLHNISKIVIHWMAGTLEGTDATFVKASSQTSAHYGIENDNIHQYVSELDTAWHAESANPFSIGIEHSAAPGRPASNETYNASIELCADMCRRYGLTEADIEPHNKYVATQCPGTIDLERIKAGVALTLRGGNSDMITTRDQAFEVWRSVLKQNPNTEQDVQDLIGRDVYEALTYLRTSQPGQLVQAQVVNFPRLQRVTSELEEKIKNITDADVQKTLKEVKSKVNELAELVK